MKRLALVTLFVVLCGIAGTSARHDETATAARHDEAAASALTAEQCLLYASDGKVDVCHATHSEKNPWVLLRVSDKACINSHSGHPDDVIAEHGPSCPH